MQKHLTAMMQLMQQIQTMPLLEQVQHVQRLADIEQRNRARVRGNARRSVEVSHA